MNDLEQLIRDLGQPSQMLFNNAVQGINRQTASQSANLADYAGNMGWGNRSGMIGKLQTGIASGGSDALASMLGNLENSRMGMYANAVMTKEQIEAQERAAKNAILASIFGGLGQGVGSFITGGFMPGGIFRGQPKPQPVA